MMTHGNRNNALSSVEMVLAKARQRAAKRKSVVAVAGAEDADVLKAVGEAHREGIVDALLVGDGEKITRLLAQFELDVRQFQIETADEPNESAAIAVRACAEGRAHILMKGKLPTPVLLKAVLTPASGLRLGQTLSHCAVLDVPGYDRLLTITDGGVLVAPNFEQKLAIIQNAAWVCHVLGIDEPRIGLLGVMDEVNPDYPATVEAANVAREVRARGVAKFIEGPLTFGSAVRGFPSESQWQSEVAGKADVLVSNNIEECNIAAKVLINLRGAIFMGVIAGAKVPLSLVSRSDPPRNKLASLALASLFAGDAP
ncbi:MAG: phosphate acyltransferase, partial [bacterium]